MRKRIFSWLGKDFVELSGEARPAATATEEARELFQRFDQELRVHGLSLANTVRSRLWGRDRESRDQGSNERVKILSGKARSASSSYIAPVHFDSNAKVAIDLLAMRPSRSDAEKFLKEYDPPIVPLRYLTYDSVVILSGVTTVLATLDEQLDNILPRIEDSLKNAGSSWDRVVKVSFFLHRSQKTGNPERAFQRKSHGKNSGDGILLRGRIFVRGKLCEIEVTATL